MSQCKVNSCKCERAPGKLRCAHHHDIYELRRAREASLPRCEVRGCGNTARNGETRCGRCIDKVDARALRREMTVEERLETLESIVFGQ